jgi:hypothetical protein
MRVEIHAMKLVVQQALDELYAENLIPFKLSVRDVESIGMGEYIVRFGDNWLPSLDVSWQQGQTFKAVFRAAVSDRVARLRLPPRLAKTALAHP